MIEEQLKEALIGLKNGIEHSDAEAIKSNMSLIDETLKSNRRDLNSQLAHYLRNRSYMKALAFLEGEPEIPKGRCGGRIDFT